MSYLSESAILRCPIDIGTSFAEEAARLGPKARESLVLAKRERLLRMGKVQPILAPTPILRLTSEIKVRAPEAERADNEGLIGPTLPESFFVARRCRKAGIITSEWIIAEVCCLFGFSRRDLVSPRRDGLYPTARQVGYWLVKDLIPMKSLPEIGKKFGGRDHTTALSGIRKVDRDLSKGGQRAEPARAIKALIERRTAGGPPVLLAQSDSGRGRSTYCADILAALRKRPSTASEIAKKLDIGVLSAGAALGALVRLGRVVHAGSSPARASGKAFRCFVYRVATA